MEHGAEAGVFEQHEHQLVSRVFRMNELRATAVMTPRTDIVYLNLEKPLDALLARIAILVRLVGSLRRQSESIAGRRRRGRHASVQGKPDGEQNAQYQAVRSIVRPVEVSKVFAAL